MKNISFKYRIFLGISFVVILFALFSIGFIKLYMTKVFHEEAVNDGLAFTKVVAENMHNLPVSADLQSLNAYLRHTMEINPEISYIFIQKDNKVLAHTFNGTFPITLLELERTNTGSGNRTISLGNNTYYDFSVPIGPSSGTLRIGISERPGADTTEHVIFVLAGITFVILAAALGISALVARRLTRPLTALSSQAAEMANRNIAGPIDMSAKDEIEQLTIAFETMLQTVREREDDLTEINNELETVNLTLHEYIERLRLTTDELIKTKQDAAVVDTARSFLHHVRQPLTYLIMAIEMLSNDIRDSGEINISSLQKILGTIEEASEKLSELLRKFDNLKEYKVIRFDEVTKITDIG